jgi:hypothetical protein
MLKRVLAVVLLIVFFCGKSFGMHPLITDDTGTQGKGKFQLELNYEYDREDSGDEQEDFHQIQTTLSYGSIDTIDLVVGLPYQIITTKADGVKTTEKGISDITVELKWRFFEREGLSFAVKPGLIIPTGDDEKGLGAGKVGGGSFFVATEELDQWKFHFNAGYRRSENTADEMTDIWHLSLATELQVCKWVKAVANIGAEKNSDSGDDTPAAFILGGLVFPVTEYLDLDLGAKTGLTEPESDYALLSGLTLRF